ncbi:histidine ammonia-lyase [Rhodothermus profundi]|uniref:Histidine ammonia-lyase n=1 Tax=Rhodothermus profundi TaxID=633813 RepID=A0A1M6WUY2_9BACT|nr:histidine ammonia-lyase [Rhodothermus profundi]SHK97466.1 histidine ammonia-lyase [Rhodothermus profundi]
MEPVTPALTCSVRIASLYDDLERRLQELRQDASAVAAARARVEAALQSGGVYYGINTGFGALARTRIPADRLAQLQENLLISHAVGAGPWLPRELCRLMLLLKIHALGLGYSGISLSTFERLLDFAERDLIPAVPSRGSVGASGDLAPLAHLALPLIGHGYFWNREGTAVRPAAEVLAEAGLSPIRLQPKDGLSLINGTQLMSACGAYVLEKALNLVKVADILAAMSLEALQGSIKPFDPRIQAVRPHPGQIRVAENVRILLVDSEILESHRHCGKVQDPYCLRCVPQVHGASRDALDYARRVVEIEINAATDNPLVFENGDILSGGNFHGQPLALALDLAAMALAELASISERRIYLLLEGHDGLPRLLMKDTGINSGFMIPQYTAAALVSENKVLCHPASVDSIPTSLGQEDHVSMGSISALKLLNVLENVEHVLAIELFTAAQALDYRLPLRPGRGVEIVHRYVRKQVPHREADHFYQEDIARCLAMIRSRELPDLVARELQPLH